MSQQIVSENAMPNTPVATPQKSAQWNATDASVLDKVRAAQMAATPMAGDRRADHQAVNVPSTPLLDGRARIAAQTPGGAALFIGTPAKFHGSPAGRKSSAAVHAASTKKAPRTGKRHAMAQQVYTNEPSMPVIQASPAPHPRPTRPIADVEPTAMTNVASTPVQSPAANPAVSHFSEPTTPIATHLRFENDDEAITNEEVEQDTDLVNTPYVRDRLQSALARQANLVSTPIADATPIAKKFEGSRAELLEKLAALDQELNLTRQRHAALVESVGNGSAVSIVDGKAVARERNEYAQQITALKEEILALKQVLADKDNEIGDAHAEIRTRDAKLSQLVDANNGLQDVSNGYKRQCTDQEKYIENLRNEIEEQRSRIEKLVEQAKHDMTVRRRLNNEIQELKGNIRVYCRVRPLTTKEKSGMDKNYRIAFPNDESIVVKTVAQSNIGMAAKSKVVNFQFSRTFGPQCQQDDIFEEVGGLVQSALDGFNVCVFAYGQTGAGKTYTMEGANVMDMDDKSKGVIPRTVEQIFEYAAHQKELSWTYEIKTSFIEIYMDKVYDLLALAAGSDRSTDNEVKVCQQRDGSVELAGLTVESVTKPEQVYDLLQRAAEHRAVAQTLMNHRSSRSHSVFQMKLSGTNMETGKTTTGCLNLVDLAGSERNSKSGATGATFKEAQAINTSLSTLGDVIRAVAENRPHIPYRNSKLTRILEPYFGGNSKTLMFVNVSPFSSDMNETISSLKFATKVASCTLGEVSKNN